MSDRRRSRAAPRWLAASLPLATILIVVWPNLRGTTGTGAETFFDVTDMLFGDSSSPVPRYHDDPSPVVVDWPRDRRLRERVRAGHFDLWNPVLGNGVPQLPDPGGLFSPLRLLLYAAPVDPYTAFVLFRVARLIVAALGAYLLARRYALSRPAGAVVSIVFGLSGGMVSQVPFAEVSSVCWLPWICWAQARAAQKGTAAAIVPLAFAVGATLAGGHQTIVAGMILGAAFHAAGIAVTRPDWRERARVASLLAAGYFVGALLAAPAILSFLELLQNGHSYKATLPAAFRTASLDVNRSVLFVGAVIPQTIDTLRTAAGFGYPYVLNFSCGILAYVLVGVAVVRRRLRLEWMLLLLAGIGICFGPPGFAWLAGVPLVKDILPRYMWALCVLPLAVVAGFGADALIRSARQGRDAARASSPRLTASGSDPSFRGRGGAFAATVIGAIALFAATALAMAALTWGQFPATGAAVVAALKAFPGAQSRAVIPVVAGLVVIVGVAVLARWRADGTAPWLLALATCVEVATIAVPHLREPPSRQIRHPPFIETANVAAGVAGAHARVGGSAPVTVGWRGWPEVRSVTPLAPRRYARFIEAGAGPVHWTAFALPGNRSALADLAAVDTVIVPKTGDANLEGDPLLVRIADIRGASIFHNQAALPRARVVHKTILASNMDEAVARLGSLAAGAVHAAATPLLNVAILEPEPGKAPPLLLNGGGPPTEARFIIDNPDDVLLEVDTPEAGYLVLADTHYPGWHATVDGEERVIYPANVGFRAVYIGAGKHQVAFRFRPASFRIGVACSIVGGLACAAIMMRAAARRRPRRA